MFVGAVMGCFSEHTQRDTHILFVFYSFFLLLPNTCHIFFYEKLLCVCDDKVMTPEHECNHLSMFNVYERYFGCFFFPVHCIKSPWPRSLQPLFQYFCGFSFVHEIRSEHFSYPIDNDKVFVRFVCMCGKINLWPRRGKIRPGTKSRYGSKMLIKSQSGYMFYVHTDEDSKVWEKRTSTTKVSSCPLLNE